ncbi:hypothetical protein BDW22DRAFT_1321927 [Trametopsis cervina]|nr:hypothetical protein BDW22DRAFT_1321927 [Trametopsis cervina]
MPSYALLERSSLTVGTEGPVFTYIDSGAPAPTSIPYTTIFATHGLAYNAHIFSRVIALAPQNNLRIVAINRRGYGGSSPFQQDTVKALATASDDFKTAFVKSSGEDFAAFVSQFIREYDIPPASADGKHGGVVFLGWSAGHGIILSALANLEHFATPIQAHFKSHVRRLIMQEPPAPIIGTPMPHGAWFFEMDQSIPEASRQRMGTIWITSYFDHGDLSSRDTSLLQYIVPSVTRAPTIYSLNEDEIAHIIEETVLELPLMASCSKQANDNYKKACFDKKTRTLVPHLRVHALCGTRGPSFSPAAFWDMQNDDKANGGGNIVFREIPGVNHFVSPLVVVVEASET